MKSFCDIQDRAQNSNHSRKSPSHNAILEKGHPNVRRLSPLNSHCTGPNKEKISILLRFDLLLSNPLLQIRLAYQPFTNTNCYAAHKGEPRFVIRFLQFTIR